MDNGTIMTINTVWGLKVPTMMDKMCCAPYIASKWALQAMMECLRMELSQNGSNIKVMVRKKKYYNLKSSFSNLNKRIT